MDNASDATKKKSILDKAIDFLFSNDPRKWLLLIFILGAFLRFMVARNISPIADEMVHGPHAIGFLHSGLISTIVQAPLWFYLTDVFFKILGVTLFSTRFLSFFFGSLSIIVVYLISSHIFNKRIGLISAFLLSVSYFIIRYSLAEMDLAATFFLLVAVYSFFISMEKDKFPLISAACIGIASLIKTLSLFFVPAFIIAFFIFKNSKERFSKDNLKKVILFGLIITFLFSPILVHNYLWYKDKGMVDVYFAQYFDIGQARQAYSGLLGYDTGFEFEKITTGIFGMSKAIFNLDPLIVPLGILGAILSFSLIPRKYWIFLISFEISGFFFLVITNWLATHYTPLVPVICIFGGFFVDKLSVSFRKIKPNINPKTVLIVILSVILVVQIYLLLPHLTSRCALSQMRDYTIDNIDKNSIVVADARIYRGRIAWLFHDLHYLESSYLSEIMAINQNLSGQNYPVTLYFLECLPDDCGWGTIQSQPDFNKSVESMISYISSIAKAEKIIYGGGGYEDITHKPYFKVYKLTIEVKPPIISMIDSTHDWFYYPINYLPKERIFDAYNVNGFFDNLMYKLAWLILIFSILLALLIPLFVVILVFKSNFLAEIKSSLFKRI